MVDYLENNCAFHVKRQRTTDREELNVIAAENTGKQEWEEKKGEREIHREDNVQNGNKTREDGAADQYRGRSKIGRAGKESERKFRERRR